MPNVEIHIGPKPIADGDKGPQIIIGFTSESFSQAVFLDAPKDPQDAVKAADALYKGYLEACGFAVQHWNEGDKSND